MTAGEKIDRKTASSASSGSRALDELVDYLRGRHGSAVNAILYYGSCLRAGDPFDGIVDVYLVVDNYRSVYAGRLQALANRLLPPNVFYKELPVENRTLRVKYSVLSTGDLRRGVSGRWMQSYLWGRFSQPVEILWSRDEAVNNDIERCLASAAATFIERVLPSVAASGAVTDLWEQGLRLSYATELRGEGTDRARELVAHGTDHYVSASRAAASLLRYPLTISGSGAAARYDASLPEASRSIGRLAWFLRRISGKCLSLARLLKALFTFEGGLDYAAWKLGRHSGQSIEIPDRVRQHPLIFVWPLLWKLYRRGVIR
ncbi:MAG: hypothetical protein ACE5G3_00345 [Gammaproteobacteria bacterium]